jgi:hypothetical protein
MDLCLPFQAITFALLLQLLLKTLQKKAIWPQQETLSGTNYIIPFASNFLKKTFQNKPTLIATRDSVPRKCYTSTNLHLPNFTQKSNAIQYVIFVFS